MIKNKKLRIYKLSEKQAQEISQQQIKEGNELWKQHCEGSKDDLSLFLKAHLLIEKYLDEILTMCLPNPKALSEKSTFAQKVLLLEALSVVSNKDIYRKLRAINKLRNYYVHCLDKKFNQQEIEEIAHGLGIATKDFNSKIILKALHGVFGFLNALKSIINLFPLVDNFIRNWDLIKKDKFFALCAPILYAVSPEIHKIFKNLKIKEHI